MLVVVDPQDYGWLADRVKQGGFGAVTKKERKNLALKAFQHVCSYDAAISKVIQEIITSEFDQYLESVTLEDEPREVQLPKTVITNYQHQLDLKYGCNPHQVPAAIYKIVTPKL